MSARARPALTQAQAAEALAVARKGPPGPWATHAVTRLLGRVPRRTLAGAGPAAAAGRVYGTVPACGGYPAHHEGGPRTPTPGPQPTGGSQGNAGLIRGAPSAGLRYGGGRHDGACYPVPAPGGPAPRDYTTSSRTGLVFHNGALIGYDRHVMAKTGTERQSGGVPGGGPNGQGLAPLADGPARPVHAMISRVYYPRIGTAGTRHLDNPGPFPVTADQLGRPQPLGTQDGSPYTGKYGGTPGLTYVTGMRGTAGVVSPAPVGGPGDGHQLIRGGPAHGLHSQSRPNAALRAGRYAATPQQKRPRRSLPANSARSGQSWSQNAQHLGGQPVTVPATAGRAPGNAARRLGR